jgi:signal transduction histidine kinase
MIIAEHSPCRFAEPRDSRSRSSRRVALIDAQGTIVAVNKDWMALAETTGTALHQVGPGVNYLEVCREAGGSSPASRDALVGIQGVLQQRSSSFAMDYACHTPCGLTNFRMSVTPLSYRNVRAVIAHTDITDLQPSKEKDFKRLQQLARRLINVQEEERKRISREIHDDLGNRIALISLAVRQTMKQAASENRDSNVRELKKIVDDMGELSTALRELSHGLHPAPLQCLGVRAALKAFQTGFKKAYGIQLDVVVPSEMPRLPDEVELCVFRVTQECLQNVAKHSGADKVKIVLQHTLRRTRLTVSDNGRGFFPAEAIQKGALGLLSMEERALSIRGRLTISSAPHAGTEVCLTIPEALFASAESATAR